MAISILELKAWLDNFEDNKEVGIDEGGLTLVLVDGDIQFGGSYIEVGGLPPGVY
jgi:hypothetical protein